MPSSDSYNVLPDPDAPSGRFVPTGYHPPTESVRLVHLIDRLHNIKGVVRFEISTELGQFLKRLLSHSDVVTRKAALIAVIRCALVDQNIDLLRELYRQKDDSSYPDFDHPFRTEILTHGRFDLLLATIAKPGNTEGSMGDILKSSLDSEEWRLLQWLIRDDSSAAKLLVELASSNLLLNSEPPFSTFSEREFINTLAFAISISKQDDLPALLDRILPALRSPEHSSLLTEVIAKTKVEDPFQRQRIVRTLIEAGGDITLPEGSRLGAYAVSATYPELCGYSTNLLQQLEAEDSPLDWQAVILDTLISLLEKCSEQSDAHLWTSVLSTLERIYDSNDDEVFGLLNRGENSLVERLAQVVHDYGHPSRSAEFAEILIRLNGKWAPGSEHQRSVLSAAVIVGHEAASLYSYCLDRIKSPDSNFGDNKLVEQLIRRVIQFEDNENAAVISREFLRYIDRAPESAFDRVYSSKAIAMIGLLGQLGEHAAESLPSLEAILQSPRPDWWVQRNVLSALLLIGNPNDYSEHCKSLIGGGDGPGDWLFSSDVLARFTETQSLSRDILELVESDVAKMNSSQQIAQAIELFKAYDMLTETVLRNVTEGLLLRLSRIHMSNTPESIETMSLTERVLRLWKEESEGSLATMFDQMMGIQLEKQDTLEEQLEDGSSFFSDPENAILTICRYLLEESINEADLFEFLSRIVGDVHRDENIRFRALRILDTLVDSNLGAQRESYRQFLLSVIRDGKSDVIRAFSVRMIKPIESTHEFTTLLNIKNEGDASSLVASEIESAIRGLAYGNSPIRRNGTQIIATNRVIDEFLDDPKTRSVGLALIADQGSSASAYASTLADFLADDNQGDTLQSRITLLKTLAAIGKPQRVDVQNVEASVVRFMKQIADQPELPQTRPSGPPIFEYGRDDQEAALIHALAVLGHLGISSSDRSRLVLGFMTEEYSANVRAAAIGTIDRIGTTKENAIVLTKSMMFFVDEAKKLQQRGVIMQGYIPPPIDYVPELGEFIDPTSLDEIIMRENRESMAALLAARTGYSTYTGAGPLNRTITKALERIAPVDAPVALCFIDQVYSAGSNATTREIAVPLFLAHYFGGGGNTIEFLINELWTRSPEEQHIEATPNLRASAISAATAALPAIDNKGLIERLANSAVQWANVSRMTPDFREKTEQLRDELEVRELPGPAAAVQKILEDTVPAPIWENPYVRSIVLFVVLSLGCLGLATLRNSSLLLGRWGPPALLVIGKGSTHPFSESLRIDEPTLYALILCAFFPLLAYGIASPAMFRRLSTVAPFHYVFPLIVIHRRFQRHLFGDYRQRLSKQLTSEREYRSHEVYCPLPTTFIQDYNLTVEPFPDERVSSLVSGDLNSRRHVLIYAPGGQGKSALLRATVSRWVESSVPVSPQPIPIFFDEVPSPDVGEFASTVAKALGRDALPEELLRVIAEAGDFVAVIDGLQIDQTQLKRLTVFLDSALGNRVKLILSIREYARTRELIERHNGVVVIPKRLDHEGAREFAEHYRKSDQVQGRQTVEISENLLDACKGADDTYLPVLVRFAVTVDGSKVSTLSGLYARVLSDMLRDESDPASTDSIMDETAKCCVDTYWQDGKRFLPYRDAKKERRDLLRRLLKSGVIIPAGWDPSGIEKDGPTWVQFFHDSVQSYFTARGLFYQANWDSLLRAAGSEMFRDQHSDLSQSYASELFAMCLEVFGPPDTLKDYLYQKVRDDWPKKYHDRFRKLDIYNAKPFDLPDSVNSILERDQSPGSLLEQLSDMAVRGAADDVSVKRLAHIYCSLAPIVFVAAQGEEKS